MPQERFAGPEYFTEFDPEAFARRLLGETDSSADTGPAEDTDETGHAGAGR